MTHKLYPWQERILMDIESGGVKPGEMSIMMAGRKIGKSLFTAQAIQRLMDDLNNRPVEDLMCSEGTVLGARYYTVEPIGGNWPDMEAWATQAFGEAAEVWDVGKTDYVWPEMARWYMNNRKFWFRNEKDRDWFIMRWRS